MDRYLSALLLLVASGCSHSSPPTQNVSGKQQALLQSGVADQGEAQTEERTSEMVLPERRNSDEMASTTIPDFTRPNTPTTQSAAGGIPGAMRADEPAPAETDILPGDHLVAPDMDKDLGNTGAVEGKRPALSPVGADQKQRDMKITQEIRRALFDSSALSFTSKNVRVVTRNGEVTLSGNVPSTRERSLIQRVAKEHEGVVNVENEIEVSNK